MADPTPTKRLRAARKAIMHAYANGVTVDLTVKGPDDRPWRVDVTGKIAANPGQQFALVSPQGVELATFHTEDVATCEFIQAARERVLSITLN